MEAPAQLAADLQAFFGPLQMTYVLGQELLEHAPASAIDAIEHRAEQVTAAVREQIRA
jgi:hypothetical protein